MKMKGIITTAMALLVSAACSGDGPLGFALPESDQRITAQPGDVILYNGSNI